jgi:predicted transcriptional regulator
MAFDPKAFAAGQPAAEQPVQKLQAAPAPQQNTGGFNAKAFAAGAATPRASAPAPQPVPQPQPVVAPAGPQYRNLGRAQNLAPTPPGAKPYDPNAPTIGDRIGDVIGGLNTGILDIVDFPVNIYNAGVGLAGGSDKFKVEPFMSALRPFVAGRPESIQKADTPVQDFLRTGAEWGVGALAPQRMVSRLPDILAGVGAASGEAVGNSTDLVDAGTAEMVGGLTGALSPLVGKGLGSIGKNSDMDGVLAFLRGNLGDEGMTAARDSAEGALARGEGGSLSDVAINPKLSAFEQNMRGFPEIRESLDGAYADRAAQTRARFDELAPTSDVNATDITGRRLTRAKAQANRLRDTRTAAAQGTNEAAIAQSRAAQQGAEAETVAARQSTTDADAAIGGTGRTDLSSAELAARYDDLEEYTRRTDVQPAWKPVNEAAPISTTTMKQEISDLVEKLPAAQRADLNTKFKGVMRNINNMDGIAEPREIQYMLSAVKQVNREAKRSGDFGTLNLDLSNISKIMDDALRADVTIGKDFENAITATVNQKRQLGGNAVAKARRSDPETFSSILNFKGDKGAATMNRIFDSESPLITDGAEAFLRDTFRKGGVKAKTLREYAPALERFPALKSQVEKAVATKQTLKQVEGSTKATIKGEGKSQTKADSALTKSVSAAKAAAKNTKSKITGLALSKYNNSPNKFVDKALNAKDDSGDLGKLYSRLKRDGGAEAFKSEALKRLKNEVLNADALKATANTNKMTLQNKIDRLVDNGVIGTKDVKEISDIIATQEGRRLRRSGGRINPADAVSETVDDAVSTLLTLPLLSALPSGHQLMAAGMFKRTFRKLMRQSRADPERVRKLGEVLTDPKAFVNAMDGKITSSSNPAEMQALFEATMQRIAVSADGENDR